MGVKKGNTYYQGRRKEMLVTLLAEVRAMRAQINDLGQMKNQNEEC